MLFVLSEATAARRRFPVYLVDATDGLTPETGEAAGQPQISKAGGAFVNTTATLTAVGNGSYYVELTATELNTLGIIVVRYKSANTAEFNMPADVSQVESYVLATYTVANNYIDATVSSRATPADVLAQTNAALDTAVSQPGSGAPAANPSIRNAIAYLFKAWRNRTTQTTSQYSLYGDDATTVHQKATFSDNGTTADRGEVASGP